MLRLSLIAMLLAGLARTSSADPWPEQKDAPGVQDPHDLPPKHKSYLLPAVEIVALDISLNLAAQAYGSPWADVDSSTMWHNLTHDWGYDADPYTTNQLAHPYCGALVYSTVRSTGHDVLTSELYTFAGSAFWEVILENEVPSLNDQLTTPIGGMFIGEAMHRFSRVLLYPGYGKPNWLRRTAASIIDPVGAANRQWWGDAWRKVVPPSMYAHFGVGWNQHTAMLGGRAGDPMVHAEVFVEHGLPGDHNFEARHPLDHFELRGAIDASADDNVGSLYMRGMLWGGNFANERVRGFGGLFAAYDFNNEDRVRASALGFGPGMTSEIALGDQGYLQTSLAAYLVPWGSAGGETEGEKAMRDYHHGPGLAQLAELRVGRRGIGSLRVTARAYEIQGRLGDDPANERVLQTTAGALVSLAAHHAIGVEGQYTLRRASYSQAAGGMSTADDASEIRAFYAITTDEILGR